MQPRMSANALMSFATEDLARAYCVAQLRPFCSSLVAEEWIAHDLRVDLMIRLKGLEDVALPIETKAYDVQISNFVDSVAQCASYGKHLRAAAFTAPLHARGPTDLGWQNTLIGTALLLAGEFNVGALYFTQDKRNSKVGGLILGGVQIAKLLREPPGTVELHPNARRMLQYKYRRGSRTWRK